MIIIYTGNGKGKTTAAIGTALRSIANRKEIVIVQFLKNGTSSEIKFLNNKTIKQFSNVTIKSFYNKNFTNPKKLTTSDFKKVQKALKFIDDAIKEKPFLFILDEILITLKFKLLNESIILKIIKQCRENNIHLILTGRSITKRLIKEADLVTEMKKIKHPFDHKVKAIKGLDY